jgi:hypothetical protein
MTASVSKDDYKAAPGAQNGLIGEQQGPLCFISSQILLEFGNPPVGGPTWSLIRALAEQQPGTEHGGGAGEKAAATISGVPGLAVAERRPAQEAKDY